MESASSPRPDHIKATLSLLYLFILGDMAFILVHALHVWSPWFAAYSFSIDADGGLAEMYQYLKLFWLAACFGVVFLQTRRWAFVGWALFFGFLMFDDMLQFHERAGEVLGPKLGIPPAYGMRTEDYGEIACALVLGVCAVGLVITTFRRGGRMARKVSADLLCLLGALALFAVFFDTLHTITHFRVPALAPVLTLIEDGGEMIVVSAIAAYAFNVMKNSGRRRVAVWPWLRARLPAFARA
jgi:hypothetical protein